ncbi:MAG: hypothetical protein IKQ12_10680 [Prevotella sp.]|nr:hypothetical protein [Prevotella sp.]
MKRTIFLLLTSILLLSSCYRNMYHFEEGDLDWVCPYNVGDVIRFETNNGTDLLYISKKTINDTYSKIAPHEGVWGADFRASAEYVGCFVHRKNRHDLWARFYKRSDGGIGASFNLGWRFGFEVEDSRNMNEEGTSIRDTVIIDDANSEYGGEGPVADDFEYFKWSKKEGLIEYRLRDGTVYPKPNE